MPHRDFTSVSDSIDDPYSLPASAVSASPRTLHGVTFQIRKIRKIRWSKHWGRLAQESSPVHGGVYRSWKSRFNWRKGYCHSRIRGKLNHASSCRYCLRRLRSTLHNFLLIPLLNWFYRWAMIPPLFQSNSNFDHRASSGAGCSSVKSGVEFMQLRTSNFVNSNATSQSLSTKIENRIIDVRRIIAHECVPF